jgi:hypothetical protein
MMGESMLSDLRPALRSFAAALPMTTLASDLARDDYSEGDVWAITHHTEFDEIQNLFFLLVPPEKHSTTRPL